MRGGGEERQGGNVCGERGGLNISFRGRNAHQVLNFLNLWALLVTELDLTTHIA